MPCASTFGLKSMNARSAEDLGLRSIGCITVSVEKNLTFQMSSEVRAFGHVAHGNHKCWLWKKWELFLSLEPCRRTALLIMRRPLAASSTGCPKNRKSGTRTCEELQRQNTY